MTRPLVAGLAFVQRLPWLLFPLLSGALADRVDRQRAMFLVAMLRATMFAVIGVAAMMDLDKHLAPLRRVLHHQHRRNAVRYRVRFGVACHCPARRTAAGERARMDGTWTVANSFVGPPLGGLLFTVAVALPFLFGAAGLAAAAVLILSLRGSFRAERPATDASTTIWGEIREGMHWLWRHELLRTMALVLTVLNIAVIAQVSIMVLFAREQLDSGPRGFGLLLTTYVAGAVLGSLAAHRVINHFGRAGAACRVVRRGGCPGGHRSLRWAAVSGGGARGIWLSRDGLGGAADDSPPGNHS